MHRPASTHPRFLRLLQLVGALSSRRFGMSVAELGRLTGVSRPSV